jgi:NDP-sugar pyrophosphorylase family protein
LNLKRAAADPALLSLLPDIVRASVTSAEWWAGELQGLHLMRGLDLLALPAGREEYTSVPSTPSTRWRPQGHALVHQTSMVHSGVSFFGPVLVGPHCELGPNATIYGPAVIESDVYLGPSVEVRRCLLMAGAEVSHLSYLGHSVIGREVCLGAFFCSAVRNLQRGTVHVIRDGELIDTQETHLGCVIADATQTGVNVTVMPGRRIVSTPVLAANSIVMRNC